MEFGFDPLLSRSDFRTRTSHALRRNETNRKFFNDFSRACARVRARRAGFGVPSPLAFMPIGRMGPPLRSFAADAHDCIVVGSLDLPHTRLWRDSTAPESGLPSDCHSDYIIVLEDVRMSLARSNQKTDDGKMRHPP